MTSFVKPSKRRIEVVKEDHSIILKNIDISGLNEKYNLKNVFVPNIYENDEKDDSRSLTTKETKSFTVLDDNVIKNTFIFKANETRYKQTKMTDKKKVNDMTKLTSSLEKLGISNKEIIPVQTFFKDSSGKETKMIISGTNEYITKNTPGCCWWCRHSLPKEWHPLGLPLNFKKEVNEFMCEGIFCSFNCIMAYLNDTNNNNIKYRECGMYVTLLYRVVFGKSCWLEKIIPSPSWKNLKEYGGRLTIDEFRNTFNKLKIVERMSFPSETTMHSLHQINLII